MDKPHDMDEITRLAKRFHALIDKVQGLIDELHTGPPPEAEGVPSVRCRPDGGHKAYTIHASDARDEKRQKALIKVIDDALNQIDIAVTTGVMRNNGSEPGPRRLPQNGNKLFTLEELHFLEQKLRILHAGSAGEPHSAGESHSDR